MLTDELGRTSYDREELHTNLVTWVYDGSCYTPVAKLTEEDSYTIVQDYLGTPIQALDSKREVVWDCLLDIYGDVLTLRGERGSVPFRFQGQYEDEETGLYYNRFRYYSPHSGNYISQDPRGLLGGMGLYSYVHNSNIVIDLFGLNEIEWNNGWRTSDGKFASPYGKEVAGQKAVNITRKALSRKGWSHLGDELSVRNSSGQLRRYDLVFKKPDGTVVGVEVKSNTASKTKSQRLFDEGVSRMSPAKGVGKFKGQEIEEVLTIKIKCSS